MNGHFSNFPVRYTTKNSSQEMNSKKKKEMNSMVKKCLENTAYPVSWLSMIHFESLRNSAVVH